MRDITVQERRPGSSQSALTILPRSNSILASLSEQDRRRLAPLCEYVHLERGNVIADLGTQVRYAYFPVRGMISLDGMTLDGTLIQLAAIQQDGVVAPTLFPHGVTPYRIGVPLPCEAFRMRSVTLAEASQRSAPLDSAIRTYRTHYATQIGLTAVCHHFHSLRKRVCRWLLVCADCTRSETIELTQERLAQMLGTSRESVSRVASRLQDQAVIRLRHGRIHIVSRSALMTRACDCYQASREKTARSGPLHQ